MSFSSFSLRSLAVIVHASIFLSYSAEAQVFVPVAADGSSHCVFVDDGSQIIGIGNQTKNGYIVTPFSAEAKKTKRKLNQYLQKIYDLEQERNDAPKHTMGKVFKLTSKIKALRKKRNDLRDRLRRMKSCQEDLDPESAASTEVVTVSHSFNRVSDQRAMAFGGIAFKVPNATKKNIPLNGERYCLQVYGSNKFFATPPLEQEIFFSYDPCLLSKSSHMKDISCPGAFGNISLGYLFYTIVDTAELFPTTLSNAALDNTITSFTVRKAGALGCISGAIKFK